MDRGMEEADRRPDTSESDELTTARVTDVRRPMDEVEDELAMQSEPAEKDARPTRTTETPERPGSKPVLLKMSFKAGDAAKQGEMPDSKVEDDATYGARSWQTTNDTISFLLALRTAFADKFSDVPDLGPQDIEEGIIQDPPSADVQILMCRFLTLAANRAKTVDYPQYNRPLSEVVERLAPLRGDPAWQGANPMPQGKKFVELDWQDRLRLMHCLGEWALQESKYCRDLVEYHAARKTRANPLACDPIGHDDQRHAYYLFKGVDTPFRLFIQTDVTRMPSRWYAIASTVDEFRALVSDLQQTACFTQRGKQLLRALEQVHLPECERAAAVRAKLLHNKERALKERYRKQAVAQRLSAQHGERSGLSRTRGKPRVDYNTMLEGGSVQQDEEEDAGSDGSSSQTPQRSFSGRLLKRKRDELPELAATPAKPTGERTYGPDEVIDGGYFGGYDFDIRSAEQIAADEAARERLKLKLKFSRWSDILSKQQQRRKKQQEEREKAGKVSTPRVKKMSPQAARQPSKTATTETLAPQPVVETASARHVLVIGSAGVDLNIANIIETLLPAAAQQCALQRPDQAHAQALDIWLHLPPAVVANPRGFFNRLQAMLTQLVLTAYTQLRDCGVAEEVCPVTVIVAGWAGYDLARESIEWLYACCREEDRPHLARFATTSRYKLQYVQLFGQSSSAVAAAAAAASVTRSGIAAASTPGGSYMGPLPAQMSPFASVAVQGTFDHLHPGHHVLLTCAAILATQTVHLGLLDDAAACQHAGEMAAWVQPLAERMQHVSTFLSRVRRRVAVHCVPVADETRLGPAGSDAGAQALVVGKDEEGLCGRVTGLRMAQGLPLLEHYIVDVLGQSAVCLSARGMQAVDAATVAREKRASSKIRAALSRAPPPPPSSPFPGSSKDFPPAMMPMAAAAQPKLASWTPPLPQIPAPSASFAPSAAPTAPPAAASPDVVHQATEFVPSFKRINEDALMQDA